MLGVLSNLRDPDIGEGLSREGKMTLDILANDGLLMVTSHIVPLDSWNTIHDEY